MQLFTPAVRSELEKQKVELPTYMTLYTPALDWILQAVAYNAPEKLLVEVLSHCRDKCNRYYIYHYIVCVSFYNIRLWDY